jgi:hypothetical protein
MLSRIKTAWRERPGTLLALYLALDWLPFVVERLHGDIQDTPLRHALGAFAVLAFLSWRVWRGGTISWVLLMLISLWGLAAITFGAVAPWNWSIYGQAALAAIQVALLFSPAIWTGLGGPRRRYAA